MEILSTMIQLLVACAIGFCFGRRKLLTEDTNARLSRVVVNVAMPAMILASLNRIDPAEAEAHGSLVWKLFNFGFFLYAAVLVLSFPLAVLLRAPEHCKGVTRNAIMFSNMGFMGYPVINAFFGPVAVFYNTLFVIHFNLFFYSAGIYFAEKDAGVKTKLQWRSFVNPGMIVCVVTLVMFLTGWRFPAIVNDAVSFIGSISTPMSIVIIGASLGLTDLKKFFSQPVFYRVTAVRLLLVPAIALVAARFFLKDYTAAGTALFGAAMPIASSVAMISAGKPIQNAYTAQLVGLTTLLSFATIPVWFLVLNAVYGIG